MPRLKKSPASSADHGSPFIRQHGDYEEVGTDRAGVTILRNKTSDQLQTYHRRNQLGDREYAAGLEFQRYFGRARIGPNYSTMDLLAVRVSGGQGDGDAVHIARQGLYEALSYVGRPLSSLVVHVVGHGHTAGSWGQVRASKRPDKDGMVALRIALSSLADYYRLT
jgi:hypothetical protein